MGKYQKFEDLPVWQEAARLYNRVLDLLEKQQLALSPGFKNQLDRMALTVATSVVQAYEQYRPQDALCALADARAAASDVRSLIALIQPRESVSRVREELKQLYELSDSCGRQIAGWMKAIENPAPRNERATAAEPAKR